MMQNISLHLVGGKDQFHGRIVVINNGGDGTVCKDQFDDNDAQVVCRMIGYK